MVLILVVPVLVAFVIIGNRNVVEKPESTYVSPKNPLEDHKDIEKAVTRFLIGFSQPQREPEKPTLLPKAYELMHPEAKADETLEEFSGKWTKLIEGRSSGWVSGFQVKAAKIQADRADVEIQLALGEAPGMSASANIPILCMTLLKTNTHWKVRSLWQ